MSLPKGIWPEIRNGRTRYRVRLYKNKVAFLKGYYDELPKALEALEELKAELEQIPVVPPRRRNNKGGAPVPIAGALGAARAIRERAQFDPNLLKRKAMG